MNLPSLVCPQFCGLDALLLSRNDSVQSGEHTRPRVFRLAPSPVGSETRDSPKGLASSTVVCPARARDTARGARALLILTAWFRLRNRSPIPFLSFITARSRSWWFHGFLALV